MSKLDAYIGVDPGATGKYCLLIPATKQVLFLPTTHKPMDTVNWFKRIQHEFNLVITMIENVHSIHGASAKSNFNFGGNVREVNILPLVAGSSVDLVTPKVWQKYIGVKTKKGDKGPQIKKYIASICDRLYPNVLIRGPKGGLLDGMSDSLMIAHYASQTFKT